MRVKKAGADIGSRRTFLKGLLGGFLAFFTLEKALEFGADVTINNGTEDVRLDEIAALTARAERNPETAAAGLAEVLKAAGIEASLQPVPATIEERMLMLSRQAKAS